MYSLYSESDQYLIQATPPEDIFKCSFCKESYDLESHAPKVLTPCNHYLCLRCLKNIFTQETECPHCNQSLEPTILAPEDFPTDQSLSEIIRSRTSTKLGDCQEHASPKKLFCITDQVPICKKCALYGSHQGHRIQIIKILKENTKKKMEKLKDLQQRSVEKKQKVEEQVEENLTKIQELIRKKFAEMKEVLQRKKSNISQNVENAVKTESETLVNIYNLHQTAFESGLAEISQLSQAKYDFITRDDSTGENSPSDLRGGLEERLTETKETLNRLLRTIGSFSRESAKLNETEAQTLLTMPVQENHESIPSPHILQEDEDYLAHNVSITCGKMEEKFEEQDRSLSIDSEKYQVEPETKPQKLDFSEKELPSGIFSEEWSEDFRKKTEESKIPHLKANFSASNLSDQQFTNFVLNVLKNIANLTSISLNLSKTKISEESIQVLSEQLLQNSHLKSFELDCSETSIGFDGLKILDDGLSASISTLETLQMILDSTPIQEGDQFLDVLALFEKLKHLKLSFNNSQIPPGMVSSIVASLHPLARGLESLDLNFNGAEIYDEILENFSHNVLFKLEKLKSLKLALRGTWISSDFMSDFFQNLGTLAARLETFELDFNSTELNNPAFKLFCEDILSNMKKLENLVLDLGQTKVTDISLKNLILPLSRLKSFTLNLSDNKIHDSGLQIFRENNSFKGIKNFEIQLERTEATDEGLRDLLNHVERARQEAGGRTPLNETSSTFLSNAPEEQSDFIKESTLSKVSTSSIPTETKRKVFAELKKELCKLNNVICAPSKLEIRRVRNYLNHLSTEDYEKMLAKILKETLGIANASDLQILEWKQVVQERIRTTLSTHSKKTMRKYERFAKFAEFQKKQKAGYSEIKEEKEIRHYSNEKKEVRHYKSRVSKKNDSGHDVILAEEVFSSSWLQKYAREIGFRNKVIELLKGLKTRSFLIFHEQLLKWARKLSKTPTYKSWKFGDLTDARNWWYRFIRRDEEVADMWKSLPSSTDLASQEYY